MLHLFSRGKPINLAIDDYAIRMVEVGSDLKIRSLREKVIPSGLVEHGRILAEVELYHFMKETVQEWKIQRRQVRLLAPDSMVILRNVAFPSHLEAEEINGHFYMELGRSLYLPFDDPILDVYPLPKKDSDSETRHGLLFAAPDDNIRQMVDLLEDAGLNPIAVDVRPLGIYRYFYNQKASIKKEDTYLFFEVNLKSVHISIFSGHLPEFLRFTELDILEKDWQAKVDDDGFIEWIYAGDETRLQGLLMDQMVELERIMNFYQFSIKKGEKAVSQIIVLGDFPKLSFVKKLIEDALPVPVQLFDSNSNFDDRPVPRSFIPALGLALKGEIE